MKGTDADSEVNFRGPRGADNLGRTHGQNLTTRVKKSRGPGRSAAANAQAVC
jgi:hypothetical protein